MKKRWLALVLAGVMAFGVCGCVKEEAEILPSPSVEPVALPSPSVEPVVTEEPVATPTRVMEEKVVVDPLTAWLDDGLWEELSEQQQKLLEELPVEKLPKEAVEWRDTRDIWEDTLIPMCYDEKNDVTLYAVTEEGSAVEFRNSGGYWNPDGIVLRVGDRTRYYPIGNEQSWTGSNPLMVVKDFNGDGKDEAAVSIFSGHGTGVAVSILYIFDLETLEYETMDLSGMDIDVSYDLEANQATLRSGEETLTVDLPEWPEDWTFYGVCAGQVVTFGEKDGKLLCNLAFDFSGGRTLWYLAMATGEVVYEDGRYTVGPLKLEALNL